MVWCVCVSVKPLLTLRSSSRWGALRCPAMELDTEQLVSEGLFFCFCVCVEPLLTLRSSSRWGSDGMHFIPGGFLELQEFSGTFLILQLLIADVCSSFAVYQWTRFLGQSSMDVAFVVDHEAVS